MLKLLICIFLGTGIFYISADIFQIPHLKTSRVITNLSKRQKKKTGNIEIWIKSLAVWLSKHIKINEYKRIQLISDLQTAEMNISPEFHLSYAFVKAFSVGLLTIPIFYIFPLISPLIITLAVAIYLKETKSVQERIKNKRNAIDYELPNLVFTIENTLKYNRDVLKILDDYRKSASPEIKHELDITVADMNTGNYESALVRLESRVGSPMLSDVVRGLISVIRGDDTNMFWVSLSLKFTDISRQTLRLQAQKIPGKVKRLSMTLLFCFIFMYLVVIGMEVINSLGAMFG